MKKLYFRVNIIADKQDFEEIGAEIGYIEKLIESLAEKSPTEFKMLLEKNLKTYPFIGGRGFRVNVEYEPDAVVVKIVVFPKPEPVKVSISLVAL